MAFKQVARKKSAPNSPEQLFNDIPSKGIAGLLSQQADTLRSYVSCHELYADIALQLPTGSGKTLIGLLIAEWRRLKLQQKAIYLCPTRQLAYQVYSQATQKYNIKAVVMCGKKREFRQEDKIRYESSEAIAITTYSGFFVSGTYFTSPETIILDDTHGAEHYIADQWSFLVDRGTHETLYLNLLGILKGALSTSDYRDFASSESESGDWAWIEKIHGPYFSSVHSELLDTLDASISQDDNIKFQYERIRNHLLACNCYINKNGILIRPLTPPTLTHLPFLNAKQRVFMSATLGEGGELERITGIRNIHRLPVPEGWEKHGTGRRFFVFPDLNPTEDSTDIFLQSLVPDFGRALVLTPSDREVEKYGEVFAKAAIFTAKMIEQSKDSFVGQRHAACILSNRYDGIDFKDDECRLLIISGMNKSSNLQERFLSSRLGSSTIYLDRIRTRILQACGRCTRSPNDYSAIVIIGDELTSYFISKSNQKYFHPEYQAEIVFGIEQSNDSFASLKENLIHFLHQDDVWQGAEEEIVELRNDYSQESLPSIEKLKAAVQYEIDYVYNIWNHNYESALENCRKIVSCLDGDDLRGYRAFWYYLTGCTSLLGFENGVTELQYAHQDSFKRAASAAPSLRWLWKLSRIGSDGESSIDMKSLQIIERIEINIQKLKTANDTAFDKEVEYIISNIHSQDANLFESAHVKLGRMFGYDADNSDSTSAPDPWWIVDEKFAFVFEDHSGASSDTIGAGKVRQVAGHHKWMIEKSKVDKGATIISIIVSPSTRIEKDAVPYADNSRYINLKDFISWASKGLATIREIRRTFSTPGDIAWRSYAMIELEKSSILPDVFLNNIASKLLKEL